MAYEARYTIFVCFLIVKGASMSILLQSETYGPTYLYHIMAFISQIIIYVLLLIIKSCSTAGINCPPPPPLLPNHVCRQQLLNEMVSKLCQSTIDPNRYGTSLTVTGAGGFGKTSLVTALCHHPVIKEKFTDGVAFIELGPQATDPSIKLSELYHLLTGDYLKQGDINHAEQEINQLTSLYCRKLLVIIDDVWHVEDAEPIVKAFSKCKIVLTTRMNDIEQHITTKHVVSVGPMEQSEARSLLTCRMIDISQLSQQDMSLLDELAQDVHLWPLLLSLIRGQLSHSLKQHKLCHHEAIQSVNAKLHNKGITAFDKNNIGRSRKHAVKVCVEVTLELLTKSLSDKIKTLILWTGIGTSLPTAVLHKLWNVTKHETTDIIDILWAYGLVQFTNTTIPPHNNTLHCVEVHAIISHYIIEHMGSIEVRILSLVGKSSTYLSIIDEFKQLRRCSGVNDTSLSARDYLKNTISDIEFFRLPFYLSLINKHAIAEPHYIIIALQRIRYALKTLPNVDKLLPDLDREFNLLISDCRKILNDINILCGRLNKDVQRCIPQRNYLHIIQTINTFNNECPIARVAQQAITLFRKLPAANHEYFVREFSGFRQFTNEYNQITLMALPLFKLYTKQLQKIYTSLETGSPHVETVHHYFISGNFYEEHQLIKHNHFIKLQEIIPNLVQKLALNGGL